LPLDILGWMLWNTLSKWSDIDWTLVDVLYMDEYLGVDANHPSRVRRWIREHVEVHLPTMNYIEGDVTAEDRQKVR
jgi:6-phosphogluconolactonase/glucosamine-6-phosphate isomerase/deaminase